MLKGMYFSILCLLVSCSQDIPRTDAELSSFFYKNRSSFEAIKSALLLDRRAIKMRTLDKYEMNCVSTDSTWNVPL
jgi:hypothetical protein